MAERVQFELVTPERLLLSEMVEMVVVPGTEGNFGVLPGHAPLISSIRPGTIDVYEGQTATRRCRRTSLTAARSRWNYRPSKAICRACASKLDVRPVPNATLCSSNSAA